MSHTLKVFINDHVDGTQNTLIGTLTGSVPIDPGPTPGFSAGQQYIGSDPAAI